MILFYHVFSSFFNCWLVLYDYCNYYTYFTPVAELVIPVGIQVKEAKTEMEL